ncbi:MAG: hypothetical protein H5T86_14820, partial [Armatimonadetes bacterium]|nr:hypothetical protein [Armatimonadota bacterium]
RTKAGTAIGLVTKIGSGVLIVTTSFALPAEALTNIYTNACSLRSGFAATVEAPTQAQPGIVPVKVTVKNVSERGIALRLHVRLLNDSGEVVSSNAPKTLRIEPFSAASLQEDVECRARGRFTITVGCATGDWQNDRYAVRELLVPPLAQIRLPRTVFLRSEPTAFSLRLVPAQGGRVSSSVCIRDEAGRSVWEETATATAPGDININAGRLRPGRYKVAVVAEDALRERKRAESTATFEVADVDRPALITSAGPGGQILLNGQPVFLLGTYHVGLRDLARVKQLGFNCVTGPIYGGEQTELTRDQLAWHDEAHRQGLWVITELSEYVRGGRRNYEQARAMVSRLRLHPATLAHYVIDEPAGGVHPEVVAAHTKTVREADPDHITLIVEVPSAAPAVAGIADATGTDPYLITFGIPRSLAWVGSSVRALAQAVPGRPVLGVIQAHRLPPPHPDHRYPTPEELRCMAYLALNNGAKGLLFYAWGDEYRTDAGPWPSGFAFSPELQEAFARLNAELAVVGLYYVSGELHRDQITVEPADVPLDVAWISGPQGRTLVVVNPTANPVKSLVHSPAGRIEKEFAPS